MNWLEYESFNDFCVKNNFSIVQGFEVLSKEHKLMKDELDRKTRERIEDQKSEIEMLREENKRLKKKLKEKSKGEDCGE